MFKIFKTAPVFWYGQTKLNKLISYLLLPLASLYCGIIALRRWLYVHNLWLKSHSFAVPIIVVGNITVGGSGKTPLVIWLVKLLQNKVYRVGVVSRGYGRKTHGVQVVSERSMASEVGDEPLLIVRRSNCSMVVGENRVAAVQKLLELDTCDVVISDDGLQHYALARALEIAVIDGERGLGNKFCLPAGPLRESADRLQDVDFIIKNIGIKAAEQQDKLSQTPMSYIMSLIPERFCQVKASLNSITLLATDASSKNIFGSKAIIHAVAGIGNPTRFFQQLRDLISDAIIYEHIFPDHHQFQATDFAFIKDNETVIMTEKDAVKCQEFAQDNWWYLQVGAKVEDAFATKFIAKFTEITSRSGS